MSFLVNPDSKARNNKQRRPSKGIKNKKDKDRDSMASSNSNEAASTGSLDGILPHTPTRRPSPGYNRGIGSNASIPNSHGTNGNTPMSVYSSGRFNYSDSFENLNTSLINSPQQLSKQALEGVCRPNSYRDKARINKGKGVFMKALKPYSCPEKETYIEADLKHPKTTKEEFQEAMDLAENYITKRGLRKAQGASFFTTKHYSDVSPSETTPSKCDLSLPYTPSMKPGPLDPPSSPLPPSCDSPLKSIMDSPVWKSGGSLRVNQDQSMDEDGENSDVDEETMEKRKMLTKLQDHLLRYIKRWPVVKDHLFKIYKGETKSLRHKLYCSAKSEDQSKLKLLRGFGPITDDDKQDELILFLSKLFEERCLQSNEDNNIVMTSYLTDVWFPEVIIFALQKTRRIGHKRAEELFVSEEKNAMEITSGALDIHLPSYLTEEEKRELLENVPKRATRQLGFSPKELGLS